MPVDIETPPPPKVGKAPAGNVCTRAGKAIAEEAVALVDDTRDVGRGLEQTARARVQKVSNWVKQLGPAGEEASRQLVRVDQAANRLAGKFMVSVDRLRKLPSDAVRAAAKAHYYGEGLFGLTDDARKAYEIMDAPFEQILRGAQVLEVKRTIKNADGTERRVPIQGSGKGYPTVLNAKAQRIVRDAKNGRHSADVIEVALEVVLRNDPEVRERAQSFNPAQRKQALAIAMGHRPVGADTKVSAVGKMISDRLEWGFSRLAEMHDESVRGIVPYLERTRIELPEQLLDFNAVAVLEPFFRRQATMLAAFREWGQDMVPWKALLARIARENGQQKSDLLRNYVGLQLGRPIAGVEEEKVLLQLARDYTMLRIFGGTFLGPLRNLGQPFTNAVDQPVGAWFRSLKELPPFAHRWAKEATELREMIIESGAITSDNPLTEISGSGRLAKISRRAATIHRATVEENEFRSAIIGYLGAQENVKRLVEMQGEKGRVAQALLALRHLSTDPAGAAARALERQGIDPKKVQQIRESAKKATPEQLRAMIEKPSALLTRDEWLTAMERSSLDSQFGYTFASRHVFSGQDDSYGLFYMLKNWGIRQLGYIRDYVLKELKAGNAKPLVKLLGTTFVLGEVYNASRDALTGSEESLTSKLRADQDDPQTVAFAIGNNLLDGGAVGILADVMWGWGNLVFGPLGGTVAHVGRFLGHTIQNPGQTPTAVKDFLDREFVVTRQARGLWNRIQAEQDEEHQRFFDYQTWRDRSFSYVEGEENPTLVDKAQNTAIRFIEGTRSYFPTERSLTYEQAAKAITANDVDAAAEHIARLLGTAKDREEEGEIIRGLNMAALQRSPLGPVPEREREVFLRRFPNEERLQARRLQAEWERDFQRAIQKGRAARRRAD